MECMALIGILHRLHVISTCVSGIPSSYVHGSIIEGIFSGRIDLPTETYYVDKSELYFDDPQPFHSVIYAGSDVAHDLPARYILSSSVYSVSQETSSLAFLPFNFFE